MYIRYKRQTLRVAIIDNNIVKTKHDWNKQTQNRQTNRYSQTREDNIKRKKIKRFMRNGRWKPVLEEYKRFPLQIRIISLKYMQRARVNVIIN